MNNGDEIDEEELLAKIKENLKQQKVEMSKADELVISKIIGEFVHCPKHFTNAIPEINSITRINFFIIVSF